MNFTNFPYREISKVGDAPLVGHPFLHIHLHTSITEKGSVYEWSNFTMQPLFHIKDNITINGIRKQNGECKSNGELGNFWNVVQFLASDGDLIEGGDYIIRYSDHLKTDILNAEWTSQRPILYMQKSRIFNLYRKKERQANEKVLPTDALKYYLQNSKAYLGEKVFRFEVYKKGVPQYDQTKPIVQGKPLPKLTVTQRAFCFDYNFITETFGICLITSADEEDDRPF